MTRARDNADLGDSYGVLGAGVTGGSGLDALSTGGELVGVGYLVGGSGNTTTVTVENGKAYSIFISYYSSGGSSHNSEYWTATVSGGTPSLTEVINTNGGMTITSPSSNTVAGTSDSGSWTLIIMLVFENA